MALGPGSIAFTGFNADGNDDLAFVVLEEMAAGTVIHFTDNEWTDSAFNGGESVWTWTATSYVAAGTVITLDALNTASPTSNLGAVAHSGEASPDVEDVFETVYAYVGEPSAPTAFLTALNTFIFDFFGDTLSGTGLTVGVNAIELVTPSMGNVDVAAFAGPAAGRASFAEYLSDINNPANWTMQDGPGDESADGTGPDVPFSTAPFTIDPNAQTVGFTAGSLNVTRVEGDSGTTTLTFTIERTGSTVGALDFSGSFAADATDAADFGGTQPAGFSGTILNGETSATVTITISGDTAYEVNEAFTLTLQSAANASTSTWINQAQATATGIIENDDPVQFIDFATGSVSVTETEGDSGTKTLTFVVERTGTGGTTGAVEFSGTFVADTTNADDFGGALPTATFSGTIADGESSAVVTIVISGDTTVEAPEQFVLTLTSAANAIANVTLGSTTSATGTIANDDLTVGAGGTLAVPLIIKATTTSLSRQAARSRAACSLLISPRARSSTMPG